MDSKVKILVGILIVGILLISGWWILSNQMIGVCSNDTPQFCDRSCKTDQECKFACGCGCISRDEKCSSNAVCKIGVCHTCRCINGKCESWFDVFKRALDTKDVALCGKIKPISCKDTCYKILAIDTKNITLCDEISNVYGRTTCRDVIKQEQVTTTTDKTEYELGEKIKVGIKNNLNQSIWYYGINEYATLYSCLEDYYYALKVQNLIKPKEGVWNDVKAHHYCCFARCLLKSPELKELKPREEIFAEWDRKVYDSEAGINGKLAEPGKYRFVFVYYLSNEIKKPNYVYSNEFTIPITPITKHNIEVVYSLSGVGAAFSDTITIRNDGSISITAFRGQNKTTKSDLLPEEEFQDFKNLILNANVFRFKDEYRCFSWCATDLPDSSLKITIDDKTKTISIYPPGDAPEKLKEIIQRIQKFEDKLE